MTAEGHGAETDFGNEQTSVSKLIVSHRNISGFQAGRIVISGHRLFQRSAFSR